MLSYKQWKSLNESVLPSFTLGVSGPQNIGLQLQNGFDLEEGRHAKKKKKDSEEPEVEVEVKEKEEKSKKDDKKCGMKCGKKCPKCSKMFSDEEDYEDEEEDKDEDEGEEEDKDEDKGEEDKDEDEGEEDEGEEDEGEEDEGEDEDEESSMKMKMSKKKMLKGSQHKLDVDGDGKITKKDFEILRKKKKIKEQAENMDNWWNSVNNMIGPLPGTKFNDGLFTPVDTENLAQAVREEPGPGEVGYAPSARLGGALGSPSIDEVSGRVTSKKEIKPGPKWHKDGEESRRSYGTGHYSDIDKELDEKEAEEKRDKENEEEVEQGSGMRFHIKKKSKKN